MHDALEARLDSQLVALKGAGHQVAQLDATVDWRLLVGLSYGRAWNLSLQVHPLYGCPWLPASAIKGALAHTNDEWKLDDAAFGSLDAAGNVVFFDAIGENVPSSVEGVRATV